VRISRKTNLVVLAASLTAVLAVGAASAGSRETVTLNMLMASSQQSPMSILIANFERVYPDIDINATFVPSTALVPLLLTQLQAGNAPDIFHMVPGGSGNNGVWPLASAGRNLNLTGEVWDKRLPAYIKEAVAYQGKTYGFPYNLFLDAVAYNKDLFKQLGLKIPTTFAQVLTMCKKITAAGKVPFIQGVAEANNGALFPLQRMSQYVYSGTPKWDALKSKGTVSFANSAPWRRTWQSILDMKDAGCFQPGAQGSSAASQFAGFARGDAVMSVMATSQFGGVLLANPTIKAGFFNLPGDTAKQSQVPLSGSILGVSATTKHPKEAKTFLQFLSRPKQAALYAKVSGGNSYYDIIKGVLPPTQTDLAGLLKSGKVVWSKYSFWPNPSLPPVALGGGLQALFTGQKSVDDILKMMDYLWDNPTASSAP
jgi:raffinose/stachyose/melibiose transport system substrate-binding protein